MPNIVEIWHKINLYVKDTYWHIDPESASNYDRHGHRYILIVL